MSPNSPVMRSVRQTSYAALVFLALFFAGPSAIHAGYRAGTTAEERAARRLRYQFLENVELHVANGLRVQLQGERARLFYWFHARGLNIDEGHEPITTTDRWRELFRYWRTHSAEG